MDRKIAGNQDTDIAIIGLACRFPGSDNSDGFWKNVSEGKETLTRLTTKELNNLGVDKALLSNPNYVNSCGFLENIDKFDNKFFKINSYEAAAMDPQQRIFIEEAYHALENAGYMPDKYDGKIGVYAGSGPTQYYYQLIKNNDFSENPQSRQLLQYLGNEKDFLALKVAYALNLTGPAININLASATGLAVVIKACQSLANNEADIMLAGASSIILPNQFGYIYEPENIFSKDGHCRPFDQESTGTVLSSGVGVVVLKRLSDAIKDNDSIHAIIKGYSINNDGNRKIGFTAPSVIGQAACFKAALEMSNIEPKNLGYLEAHGTGTKLGDPIEISALAEALKKFNNTNQFCAIGSIKGNIGHAQSAAGMAGLLKAIFSIKNKLIPPSINYQSSNLNIDFLNTPFYVNTKLTVWNEPIRNASVNSLAMGGVNCNVILENYESSYKFPRRLDQHKYNIIPLSANSRAALDIMKQQYVNYFSCLDEKDLTNDTYFYSVIRTLQFGRKDLPIREVYFCRNIKELREDLLNTSYDLIKVKKSVPESLLKFGKLWLTGDDVKWNELSCIKLPSAILPQYPFDILSHWLINNENEAEHHEPKVLNKSKPITSEYTFKFILEKITQIWCQTFKVEKIDHLKDNFEALGGDSLLAIDIITNVEKQLNMKISMDEFMRNYNVVQLSKHLLDRGTEDIKQEKLVNINSYLSENPNIFIIHPGDGELYHYEELGKFLDKQINLIGIHNSIFNDINCSDVSIKSLANNYIELISKADFDSPFILCGWSFGAVIAYEMVRQLESTKKEVKQLYMIDGWAKYSKLFNDDNYFFNIFLENNKDKNLALSGTGLWGELLWKRMNALINYMPSEIESRTTLFKASSVNEEYKDVNAYDNHWQNHCENILSIILVEGDHKSIVELPGIKKIAETLLRTVC